MENRNVELINVVVELMHIVVVEVMHVVVVDAAVASPGDEQQ